MRHDISTIGPFVIDIDIDTYIMPGTIYHMIYQDS